MSLLSDNLIAVEQRTSRVAWTLPEVIAFIRKHNSAVIASGYYLALNSATVLFEANDALRLVAVPRTRESNKCYLLDIFNDAFKCIGAEDAGVTELHVYEVDTDKYVELFIVST